MSKWCVEQADFVLAVIHGVVHGIFVLEAWLPATPENFPPPRFTEPNSPRWDFRGRKADSETWEHYVGKNGKRLPNNMRHS
ncbi:MAG: hypothetical protein Q4G22_14850 [Paracoccus sp. (in: a-proteobacteria)]|nr:hypothetical protein [Paracoccus sp. (in: a-proteobacteria)]